MSDLSSCVKVKTTVQYPGLGMLRIPRSYFTY